MQISSTAAGAAQTAQTGTGKAMSGLAGEDFMNLLIKQLQYQDPLKPMGNEEMMRQMATIRELEMNTRLTERLEQLTDQQRFGSAASLIGRKVKGIVQDSGGNEYGVEGVVQSIMFTPRGEIMLELDTGETLPLSGLAQIEDAAVAAGSAGTQATDNAKSAKAPAAAKGIAGSLPAVNIQVA